MDTLRIYFSESWQEKPEHCQWAIVNDEGRMMQSGKTPLERLPENLPVIGIVSADQLLSVTVAAPAGSPRRWQQALPFLAEEHCIRDPENNHVVPGPKQSDGNITLYIIDKHWMTQIITTLEDAGFSLRALYPETLLPPVQPGQWTLVMDAQAGFIRTDPHHAYPLDHSDLNQTPAALQLLTAQRQSELPELVIIRYRHTTPNEHRQLPQWPDLALSFQLGEPWDWRQAEIREETVNLLWGAFSARSRLGEVWPTVKPAIQLAALVLGLQMALMNIHWATLVSEKNELQQQMTQSFRDAFGEQSVLVDAPLQMQRNLSRLRHETGLPSRDDLLTLLDRSAPVLDRLPAGSIRKIEYGSGRVTLTLSLTQQALLTGLQQQIEQLGLNWQNAEIKDHGNRIEATVALTPGHTS